MPAIRLTGPAAEPVTLSEAKAWLRLDTNDEDDLVTALIASARAAIEAHLRRVLMAQTWRLVLDAWPQGNVLHLPFAPLISISAIRVFDAADIAQVIATASTRLDAASDPARLVFITAPPTPARSLNGIEVDAVCGYGNTASDVPAPIRQALKMLIAQLYENRGDAAGEWPASIIAVLAPFRRMRLA